MFVTRKIDTSVDRKQNANKFFQGATPNYVCYRNNIQVAILLSDIKTEACLAIFVVSFDVIKSLARTDLK